LSQGDKVTYMYTIYCELSGFCFSLSTDALSLRGPLESLYPALRSAPGPCHSELSIRLETLSEGPPLYTLYDHDLIIQVTPDRSGVLECLEWMVLRKLLHHREHFLQLHAAGAVRNGHGLLLCGPSGSGKSTLALALLLGGWKCLSDEITLIEPECGRAWPFPRSFHLKEETLRMFPMLTPFDIEKGFVDRSGKRRFDPSVIKRDWVSHPASPTWLIFPTYRPDGPEGLTPLGETGALSMLIDQTINLETYGAKGLDILLRLIRGCSCYSLQMRDLHSGCALLDKLTKGSCKPSGLCQDSLSAFLQGQNYGRAMAEADDQCHIRM
jgi:hypothetical protein